LEEHILFGLTFEVTPGSNQQEWAQWRVNECHSTGITFLIKACFQQHPNELLYLTQIYSLLWILSNDCTQQRTENTASNLSVINFRSLEKF